MLAARRLLPSSSSSSSKHTKKTETYNKASVRRKNKKLQGTYKRHPDDSKLKHLHLLKDAGKEQQEQLMIEKLQLCCVIYDFMDKTSNIQGKEMKQHTLQELIEYISTNKDILTEHLYPEVVKMVSINIFRPLPFDDFAPFDINHDIDDNVMEASWDHLVLVYDFLMKFLDLPDFDPSIGSKHFNRGFLVQLLDVFNSGDPRERLYVKSSLHKLYGKLLVHRSFIRQHISNIFLRFIYETEKMNGISELLEIYGSIINGFALPLKTEHKIFLKRILIPLHTPATMILYHTQLVYCVTQFLEKDPTLTEEVILGLIKFWPKTSSQKQVLFLNEIEEILDTMESQQFIRILCPLFKKLAVCMASDNFLVSQRALYIWNNEYIVSLIEGSCDTIMPILFPALCRIANEHWSTTIMSLVGEVLRLFKDMRPVLFESLKDQYREET